MRGTTLKPTIFVAFATMAILPRAVEAVTSFSNSSVVARIDRAASFDSLNANGIDLSTYSEGALSITTPGTNFQGFVPFLGDARRTGYHYPANGNDSFVTIIGLDGESFSAVELLFADGARGDTANLRWETYRGGVLAGSGLEIDLDKGTIVGWSDPEGFDELRVAAGRFPSPGFGSQQAMVIDDLAATVIPEPSSVLLIGLGLLSVLARRRVRARN